MNDGDANFDEFVVTRLAMSGNVPVATVRGVWETTDPVKLTGFLPSFNKAGLKLGDPIDFYANIHTNQFPGGAIRGQLTLLATDAAETINGWPESVTTCCPVSVATTPSTALAETTSSMAE